MLVSKTWHIVEDGAGACLVVVNGDPNVVADRVAFIEKTPRIRIRQACTDRPQVNDWINWAERPFKGDGVDDPASREWCESALVMFGYSLI